MKFEIGDTLRITGHPPREAWMADLVGKVGKVEHSREIAGGKVTAVRVNVERFGPVYLSARYLEEAPEEEPGPDTPLEESEEEALF